MAKLARELIFETEDAPGKGAGFLQGMAGASVSVLGMLGYVHEGKGFVHVVVEEGTDVGGMDAYAARSGTVVVVEAPNETGSGADVLAKLSNAGINIKHVYATSPPGSTVLIVINTEDNAAAVAALN